MRSVTAAVVIIASGAALTLGGGVTALAFAGHRDPVSPPATHVTAARPPLRVVSVSPADGSGHVNGANPVTVTFNQPLPPGAAFPRLSPGVAGTWTRSADTAVFTPATGFPPGARVKISVPAADATSTPVGTTTPRAPRERPGYSASFTTARYSTLRLQQLLAQMGYLPMSWSPHRDATVTPGSLAAQAAAAYDPPAGSFRWKSGYPDQMYGLWTKGKPNLLDAGAIAGFEADHGLRPDGIAGPHVWAALLKAAVAGQRNKHGYSYAIASESIPESLTIWHNGHRVLSSPANTGIAARPTVTGTFFVYEKLTFQVMRGTNPDGSQYADPVQWVSYFNGGDAVHYIPRGSFGWPQSLGCVELPYSEAEESYGYLPYGTVVSVDG